MIFICVHETIQIFFRIYQLQVGEGRGLGMGMLEVSQKFSSIILGKDGYYWNTVVLYIGTFLCLCRYTECCA